VALLVFAITPKDIFHEFHDHLDEIEHIDLECHNQHFEKKHTHCPTLEQVSPIFYANVELSNTPFFNSLSAFKLISKVFVKTPTHFLFCLKAPPSIYCQLF
jgi:hypothetical protein